MDGTGLIAPLELARFAAAYLLLAILPGYALATLARPRTPRVERLALALPCALSVVTLYGLATALLRLPFTTVGYAAIAAAIGAGSLAHSSWLVTYRSRRPQTRGASISMGQRNELPRAAGTAAVPVDTIGTAPADDSRAVIHTWRDWRRGGSAPGARDHWWLAAAGVGALDGLVALLIHAGAVVPAAVDVLSHVVWTDGIARSHAFSIALLSAHPGARDGAFYPPAFHAMAALLMGASGVAAYRAVFYTAVLAVPLLPLALFAYVRAIAGSARLAGLAALASLAFEPLPFFALAQGLYPFVVSCLFIPALVLVLSDGLGRGHLGSAGLAALLGVGLFYTHPTEFVTVGLLLCALAPAWPRGRRAWLRAGGYGAVVAAAWAGAALPALAAVRRTMVGGAQVEIQARHDFVAAPHTGVGALLNSYVYGVYGRNVSYPLCALALAGAVWLLARRRQRGLVVVQLALLAVYLDASSLNLLRPLYVLSFPWALGERLAPTHYWVTPWLAALGLDATLHGLHRLRWPRGRARVALLAAPCAILGLLLPLDVAARHSIAYNRARTVVAPADLGALAWLRRHGGPDALVVDDADPTRPAIFDVPIDAGRWMPALGAGAPLFAQGGAGPGPLDERLYLARHIADRALPPRAARDLARYRVRYVFYGAAVPPGATRQLNLPRLLADPRLTLAYTSAPACRDARAARRTACARGQAYLFALRPSAGRAGEA